MNQILYMNVCASIGTRKHEGLPSNLQIVGDTKPELCTRLSCRALETQPGQNFVLQNMET